ncbi:MAG: TatD family hydrolase [Flavobacteriaceae bacterium]|jgi:TatD DNase family protein|nr:TatD family hydrolase [Flavobacteriaceae bacterium]MDO7580902.1 TatD family hydrolase [Flavobacteriaceae bacterium]MDO7591134.1 TatD family hydrolase [Flavobacteriaceae bacterium]MDO7598924.1 TatD family hydrolase [Flavobacteriaceae bacterium]MDO7603531.1 TatD family hydrolase [Flavobacteriaceae bacterium]|tara:strand:- start:165 stop:929 length:765 start_codon:yes stop_codon:yes gene_type:complete
MQLIDTHTHLYSETFDEDQDAMIQRALACGVTDFFIPAIDSTYTERMFALEKKYPNHMHLMTGVHPTHVKENYKEELNHVASLLKQRSFCALGEIGIDLYWDKTFLKEQQEAFDLQIQWAKEHKLPFVIHCRDAFDEVFEVLDAHDSKDLRGIFHCFTGTLDQAKQALSYNLKLGIGGVVTFKNGKIDQFLNQIPLSEIVLETDAPYLAPVPFRGKRNESSYIQEVASKVAEVYNLPFAEIASITSKNALAIFK